jgi:hypothetical protein
MMSVKCMQNLLVVTVYRDALENYRDKSGAELESSGLTALFLLYLYGS